MYDIEVQSEHDARLYPAGEPRGYACITLPETWVHAAPDAASARLSQYTYGEPLRVFDQRDGWLHAQSLRDHYSGWIPETAAEHRDDEPAWTHITLAVAPVTAAPDLKSAYLATLPPDACLTVTAEEGDYLQLHDGGWLHRRHTTPADLPGDIITAARRHLGRSYVWGGRGTAGLDCSALAQWSYRRAGYNIPRDSDLQEKYLDAHHTRVDSESITRGDLLYLPGHVMIANDAYTVIHASGYQMQVVVENLSEAIARYKRTMGEKYRLRAYRWDAKTPFVHVFE